MIPRKLSPSSVRCVIHRSLFIIICGAAVTLGAIAQGKDPGVRLWMPDVVSSYPNVRDLTMSPDGSEYYFSVENVRKDFSVIVVMRRENGRWTAPEVASFSGQYRDIEPAFAPDGRELYFASARPTDGTSTAPKDYDIWKVTRPDEDSAWSAPVPLGAPVNSDKNEYYPSLTARGDVYFTREAEDPARKEDIFVSRKKSGVFEKPEPLSDAVNSPKYEFNAFVAPDESYIIFTSFARPDDMGGGDLYISYNRNGQWTQARHMGPGVNSNRIDYCPYVDTRNGILYFTSDRSEQRTAYDAPRTLRALLEDFRTGPVGSGRIFSMPFRPAPPLE